VQFAAVLRNEIIPVELRGKILSGVRSTQFHKYDDLKSLNLKQQFDLTTEAQRSQRSIFFRLPGDDGKRKASMLEHKEDLNLNK
jgi:hypothetical protein